MTEQLLHIGFTFQGVPKVLDLEAPFSTLGDWVRYSQTGWLLWTDHDTSTVVRTLFHAIDSQDNVFVSVVDGTEFIGRQPMWIWDWLKQKTAGAVTTIADDPDFFANLLPPPRQ